MRTLKDIDLRNKRAVLRLDLNVPIQDNKISDDSRIIASLPTIHRVLKDAKNLLIISHLGRPEEGVNSPLFKRGNERVLLWSLLRKHREETYSL